MNNTEKFLELYNELDTLLRDYYHEKDRSNSVITRLSNDLNKTFIPDLQKIGKKLNMIRILRNNLIHDLNMNSGRLIEITDYTIAFMEELIEKVKHPKSASNLMTPISKVYSLNVNNKTKVIDIMETMRRQGYSQVPILNDYKILKGVFSPNALFSFIHENPNIRTDEITLDQIIKYLEISKHFSESYVFVKKSMSENDVGELFEEYLTNNKKLVMAFVTENGTPHSPVLGIIVLSDILRSR